MRRVARSVRCGRLRTGHAAEGRERPRRAKRRETAAGGAANVAAAWHRVDDLPRKASGADPTDAGWPRRDEGLRDETAARTRDQRGQHRSICRTDRLRRYREGDAIESRAFS